MLNIKSLDQPMTYVIPYFYAGDFKKSSKSQTLKYNFYFPPIAYQQRGYFR